MTSAFALYNNNVQIVQRRTTGQRLSAVEGSQGV
jgi:hypothetical protein